MSGKSLETEILELGGVAPGLGQPLNAVTPVRVLHVIDRLDWGGTELAMLNVIRGLSGSNLEHRVCAVRGVNPAFPLLQAVESYPFVAGGQGAGLQFPLFRLVRIIRSYRPHVVHSRNWGAIEAIAAARIARVPIVIHSEHGYDLEMLNRIPIRRRLFRHLAYRMTDAVFAVSEELRDYHARQARVPRTKIRVIRNGVDTKLFAPRSELRRAARQSLSLPEQCFVVGTVGRVVPIKDHATLLRAASALIRQGVDLRVLVVGSGPGLGELRANIGATPELNGKVLLVGSSEQVSSLLNAMDAFVLSSVGEGISNTLLEAMASGLAVIATRVGGNPEVVEENRSGWLFSPRDHATLAGLLGRLARQSDLARRAGAAARERVSQHFSLESMLDAYRRLYLDLAQKWRSP